MIKKGSHLDNVEPINEQNINNEKFIEILRNKIGNCKTLDYIISLVNDYKIYDKSGYSGNSVLILKSETKNNLVLKISKSQKLYEEYVAYNYFYKNNLTSKPIAFFKEKDFEIMITEYINLPTAGNYFNSFEDIAVFLGKELKKFHEIKFKSCNKEENYLFRNKYNNSLKEALKNSIPLKYMVMYLGENNVKKMKQYLIDNQEFLYKNEVLVHGDINPNNIFVGNNYQLQYIDFCDSGYCNKHYDIFWTLFMIIIFSGIIKEPNKINKCEKLFLESYGKNSINEKELLYFKYFACLYWKEHDEITRINIL